MKIKTENDPSVTPAVRRSRWWRRAVWLAGGVVLFAVLGFLAAPPLVKPRLEQALSDALHRKATIAHIKINPFALSATVQGLTVNERGSDVVAVSLDEFYARVSAASLWRLAPVVSSLKLTKPYFHLVRNADKTYNYQDLIDEFLARPKTPTARFSLNNIEVMDGRIDFDDRPEKLQHTVSAIRIGLPFVSSLPYAADINVQPAFSAMLNGSPLVLNGDIKPFKDSRDAQIKFDIHALQLPKLLEYVPLALKFRVPSAQLDGTFSISFAVADDKPHLFSISGQAGLSNIVIKSMDGAEVASVPRLSVDIGALDLIGASADIKSISVENFQARIKRLKNGSVDIVALLPGAGVPAETVKHAAAPAPAAAPFKLNIADIKLSGGKLHIADEVPAQPFQTDITDLALEVHQFSMAPNTRINARLAFSGDLFKSVVWTGSVSPDTRQADGKLEINGLQLAALRPYYADLLDGELTTGTLDASTSFTVGSANGQVSARLDNLEAALNSLEIALPGDRRRAALRVPELAIKNTAVDITRRSISIGELSGHDAAADIVRDQNGRINLTQMMKVKPTAAAANTQAVKNVDANAASGTTSAPWQISVNKVALAGFSVGYADQGFKPPARMQVTQLAFDADNLSTAANSKGRIKLRADVNKNGRLALIGTAGMSPLSLDLRIDAAGISLIPIQALIDDKLNIVLAGGAASAKGWLTLDMPPANNAEAAFKGELSVANFAAVDKLSLEDLLKWKSLTVNGIDVAATPFKGSIAGITLADFYSRLIVNPDGTLNLQHLSKKSDEAPQSVVQPTAAAAVPAPAPAPESAPAVASTANGPGKSAALPPPAGGASLPTNLTVEKIVLQNGAISFADHFIKPNYSADLSDISGSVGKMTPDIAGSVELHGRVQKTAPLDITGSINPFGKDLFADIKADAKDIDLPPLTAYSVKYAGYGIDKGKLSMNVNYHVENRKLTAQNRLYLDQLTFGPRVESATATKLPVLLAVALLKDRNGVIDIQLPITGSLDDPQFSVGSIVVRIIVNLLVKAVTSPFALIGSIFGGGSGEELSYVEFQPGRAAIDAEGEKKVEALGKALTDRPALKIEISGRVDPATDLDGARHAAVERKVKAQKLRAMLRRGQGDVTLDSVTIDPAEYEGLLTAAYRDESFKKPRNIVGMTKKLSVAEMEQLMMENTTVSDADLRTLADDRAQAVQDRLVRAGKISTERIFLVAPHLSAEGVKDKGKPNRADFALK